MQGAADQLNEGECMGTQWLHLPQHPGVMLQVWAMLTGWAMEEAPFRALQCAGGVWVRGTGWAHREGGMG